MTWYYPLFVVINAFSVLFLYSTLPLLKVSMAGSSIADVSSEHPYIYAAIVGFWYGIIMKASILDFHFNGASLGLDQTRYIR